MIFLLPRDSSLTQSTLWSIFASRAVVSTTVLEYQWSLIGWKRRTKCGDFSLVVSRHCRKNRGIIKEDVQESNRNYDNNKRSRTFQNSWTKGRPWLVFQEDNMFCSICKEATAVDVSLSHKRGHLILSWVAKKSRKLGHLATKHWS